MPSLPDPNLPRDVTSYAAESLHGAALLSRLFSPDVVLKFKGLNGDALTHSFSPVRYTLGGREMRIDDAQKVLASIKDVVFPQFEVTHGKPFSRYEATQAETDWVRKSFYSHYDYQKALQLLDIPTEQGALIAIPWFNEVAAGEAQCSVEKGHPHIQLCPRHSYETQLMRLGIQRPVRNVSVMALLFTKPDPTTGVPEVVVGLRGGKSYYNSFHLPAGALELSDDLKGGSESIFDVFLRTELVPETGLTPDDCCISLWGRIDDRVLDHGPGYIFRVDTGLSADEIVARFNENGHIDRGEHRSFHFIPSTQHDIRSFIERYYRGAVVSDTERSDDQRRLLHPAALVLAGVGGISLGELSLLYARSEFR